MVLSVLLIIFIGLVVLPTGGLTIFHIYLSSKGMTTNEYLRSNARDVYDHGFVDNCKSFWVKPVSRIFCEGEYDPEDYVEKEANVFIIKPELEYEDN